MTLEILRRTSRPLLSLILVALVILATGRGLPSALGSEDRPVRIRVMVAEDLKSLTVRGLDLTLRDAGTELELSFTGESGGGGATSVILSATSGVLSVNGAPTRNSALLIESAAQFLTLNEREYRSPLEVRLENGRLVAINHLTLEQYLSATVAGEMPAAWPLEALKAQAIVARSYAWKQIQRSKGRAYDLVADVRDQVFPGSEGDKVRTVQAVKLTEGVVLVKDGEVLETFYHSTCGGSTELASNVWSDRSQALPAVVCRFCRQSPHAHWVASLMPEELARKLKEGGFKDGQVRSLEVVRRSPSGRALEIRIAGDESHITVDGNTLRRLVGYDRIKSARFVTRVSADRITLEGEGFGHGVGMCQWGARGMAQEGKKAEDILNYYYPGTQRGRLTARPGAREGDAL